MLKLKYELVFPNIELGHKIADELNLDDNIEADVEFKLGVPRKVILEVSFIEQPTPQNILEVGIFIGTLEKY